MNPFRALRILHNLARQRTGLDPAHGVSLCHDLGRLVPKLHIGLIFDVGANRGQSATEYHTAFPDARIYSFEPVQRAYQQLLEKTKPLPRVTCHNLALGSTRQTGIIAAHRKSELSYVVDAGGPAAPPDADTAYEPVFIDTIQDFCRDQGVAHIDLLKLDTEGHDMEVLCGAERMLDEMRIEVVQVEAGISRSNTTHVALEAFREYLESRSYFLFGFYDQIHEWPAMKPNLRRVNAVFISRRLMDVTTTA